MTVYNDDVHCIINPSTAHLGVAASEPKPAGRGRSQKSSAATQSRSIMQGRRVWDYVCECDDLYTVIDIS